MIAWLRPPVQPQVRACQMRVLGIVHDLTRQHGRAPTIVEIMAVYGATSTSTVASHLRTLQSEGLLASTPRKPRSLVVTARGLARLGGHACLASVIDLLARAGAQLAALDAERIDQPYAGAIRALEDIAESLPEVPA